jgi:hypothetical protein
VILGGTKPCKLRIYVSQPSCQVAQKNTSSENQAHGRIYRIGQKKPTFFVTAIVEDTIDEGVVECELLIQEGLYQ